MTFKNSQNDRMGQKRQITLNDQSNQTSHNYHNQRLQMMIHYNGENVCVGHRNVIQLRRDEVSTSPFESD